MLTFTFAGDESGDVSFSFSKGASRYFVVAVVATTDPEGLRNLLVGIRQNSKLPIDYEFKFHALSSSSLRQRVFTALANAPFESWALVVDKTILPDSYKVMSSLEFFLYFVTELIRTIPPEKRTGATLILDEFGSGDWLRTELRRVMKIRGIPSLFKRILVKRSRSEPLIQIADLVAGEILRRDTKNDSDAFENVEHKFRSVLEYQP